MCEIIICLSAVNFHNVRLLLRITCKKYVNTGLIITYAELSLVAEIK